jgi:hypothetical protein
MFVGSPAFVTGEPQRNYNFTVTLLPPTRFSTEYIGDSAAYKGVPKQYKDMAQAELVAKDMEQFVKDVTGNSQKEQYDDYIRLFKYETLAYISSLIKSIGYPGYELLLDSSSAAQLGSVEFPGVVSGLKLGNFVTKFYEDSAGIVSRWFKLYAKVMTTGYFTNTELVEDMGLSILLSRKMGHQGMTGYTYDGYLQLEDVAGVPAGATEAGSIPWLTPQANNLVKKAGKFLNGLSDKFHGVGGAVSGGIAVDDTNKTYQSFRPSGWTEKFVRCIPTNVGIDGEFDKAGNDITVVSVTWTRFPRITARRRLPVDGKLVYSENNSYKINFSKDNFDTDLLI